MKLLLCVTLEITELSYWDIGWIEKHKITMPNIAIKYFLKVRTSDFCTFQYLSRTAQILCIADSRVLISSKRRVKLPSAIDPVESVKPKFVSRTLGRRGFRRMTMQSRPTSVPKSVFV